MILRLRPLTAPSDHLWAGGFESGFEAVSLGSHLGGGQTREHAQLAKSLGVDQLVVVVSKLDTCGFSQTRFEEIRCIFEG